MREIKFRAYDTHLGFMVEDSMYIMGIGTGNVFFDNGGDLIEQTNKLVLMQYTGLKDKNGKEIYEGDIVRSLSSTQQVYFKNGCFGIKSLIHEESFNPHPLYKMNVNYWEVIGNIYENPELLK